LCGEGGDPQVVQRGRGARPPGRVEGTGGADRAGAVVAVRREALGDPLGVACVLFDLVRCQALADQEVDALLAEAERAMGGNGVGTECRMP
jgi:hypothetical protein